MILISFCLNPAKKLYKEFHISRIVELLALDKLNQPPSKSLDSRETFSARRRKAQYFFDYEISSGINQEAFGPAVKHPRPVSPPKLRLSLPIIN